MSFFWSVLFSVLVSLQNWMDPAKELKKQIRSVYQKYLLFCFVFDPRSSSSRVELTLTGMVCVCVSVCISWSLELRV